MKYLKCFESFNNYRWIGYHCTDIPNLDELKGGVSLGQYDYWEWHEKVLENISEKYPDANKYLERIDRNAESMGFNETLTTEINEFLNKHRIKGIFVNESEPNYRWGEYCYEVYLEKIEFDRIQDFKMLEDEGDEYSFLYIYQDVSPKFVKIN